MIIQLYHSPYLNILEKNKFPPPFLPQPLNYIFMIISCAWSVGGGGGDLDLLIIFNLDKSIRSLVSCERRKNILL